MAVSVEFFVYRDGVNGSWQEMTTLLLADAQQPQRYIASSRVSTVFTPPSSVSSSRTRYASATTILASANWRRSGTTETEAARGD